MRRLSPAVTESSIPDRAALEVAEANVQASSESFDTNKSARDKVSCARSLEGIVSASNMVFIAALKPGAKKFVHI